MDTIRIMIVDDHSIVREGLKRLLEIDPGVKVITESAGGMECLESLEEIHPDVVFMDVKMPGISGIEITRLIKERHPQVKVIMLSIHDDEHFVTESIRAGANGYILKNAVKDQLIRAIHNVMEGKAFLDPSVTTTVLDRIRNGKDISSKESKHTLTKRELEVLELLVSGLKGNQISNDLNISEHTVRSHIKNIYRKLKVSSKSQAVVKAIQLGIVDRVTR